MPSDNSGIQREPRPLVVKLTRAKYALLLALGILTVVYHLWFARTAGLAMDKHMVIHLGTMMAAVGIVQLDVRALEGGFRERFDNFLLIPIEIVAGVAVTAYLLANYSRLAYQSLGIYSQADVLVGIILIILILDLTRRSFGLVLPVVGVIGIFYALYGQIFPTSILQHQGIAFNRLVTSMTVGFSGIFDTILQVSATYIVIFIIFAGFLESYGALEYFIKIGAKAGKYVKSGITQTAVISSIGMGSVNGSAAANSATTGAFTIPLLKSQGINKDTAASIESVASSGGQIMPPIMGAAAFIMADITGTSYVHIISIGLLPALLFYATTAYAVHTLTLKEGANAAKLAENINSEDTEFEDEDDQLTVDDMALGQFYSKSDLLESTQSTEGRLQTVLNGMYLWIPVGVLVYLLVVLRYTPLYAGFFATLVTIPTALVQSLVTENNRRKAIRTFIGDTLDACRQGMENAAPIALAAAVMGLFVGVLNLTGFTQAFAQVLVDLSGGVLVLLLFFAMIASILFGMGMPTVAAYIVSVLLIAPALTDMGLRLETAHFFVFYFAILSALTPPVAIACIITTELADGNFWRVCKKSILLGAPLFILPYVFVANPGLLYWTFPSTILTALLVLLGLICVSAALLNYMEGLLSRVERGMLLAVSLIVIFTPILPLATMVVLGVRLVFAALLLGFFVWKTNLTAQFQRMVDIS